MQTFSGALSLGWDLFVKLKAKENRLRSEEGKVGAWQLYGMGKCINMKCGVICSSVCWECGAFQ